MKLRARPIDLEAGGKSIVILHKDDAGFLGLHSLERVKLIHKGQTLTAIIDITEKFTSPGEMVVNYEVTSKLNLNLGDSIEVQHVSNPISVGYVKEKIRGFPLNYYKYKEIVKDVVANNLSDIEMTGFVSALDARGITMEEAYFLSKAMIDTGKILKIKGKIICDKHSIGGIPGDKTSLLVVPIVAAAGLIIPKSSSRAITSPAGTADRMEVLAPVELEINDIVRIVGKAGGCLVWGGALDLAPADDAFIQIEYPLGIDPLLLPSIMSKKKAMGATHVVIDMPTGRGAKIKTIGEAHNLADSFIELGNRLGIKIACGATYGEQPLGYAIGPALEAREALTVLQGKGPEDVRAKVSQIGGILFEMVGKGDRRDVARLLKSGKAEKKMRQIIELQGGNPKVKPSDIVVGDKTHDIKADRNGIILWIKNAEIGSVAKRAGAPKDRAAGVLLYAKTGDRVKKGQKLFTIFASNEAHLSEAIEFAEANVPVIVGSSLEEKMLMDRIPSNAPHRRAFMLDR
ncbi:MAG: AMP phosphorylase [Nanoarchaeota archaeon]|nr:AMP phosphorylase [Nanoarchaeota archaeon]MBU4124560.1 AMP phosphorylase [Nanoarchaeota archaeon]